MDGAPHRDELRAVEDHSQTEHKLDLVRRYFGAYMTIMARVTKSRRFAQEVWVVDTHAGAGLHRSREDPDGARFGTPLIACSQARLAQRLNPGFRVHVRAIEKGRPWAQRLQRRVIPYLLGPRPEDQVDVKVLEGDFAGHVAGVLADAARRSARSLWFVDPYGFRDIPYAALEPLSLRRSVEMVINLDLKGIWRKIGRADDRAAVDELLHGEPDQQRALRELFGGTHWRAALLPGGTYAENLVSLANAYANRFPTFRFRRVYRLPASDGQVRFMVHLTHTETAVTAFEHCHEASLKVGLLAGRATDPVVRAEAAARLFETYRGMSTTIDEVYEAGIVPFNRAQLPPIFREAEVRGYGTFDEAKRMMSWLEEREGVQRVLPLE